MQTVPATGVLKWINSMWLKLLHYGTLGLAIACFTAVRAQPYRDPAPPEVKQLQPVGQAEAKAFEGWVFHGAPRPFPAGAVRGEWRSFLGPRHNGVSGETKLLGV